MFGVGGQELILLLLIGLIVLGPERLPRIARQMGNWLGQARRMTRVMKRQLEEELDFNQSPIIKPPPEAREPSQKAPAEEEATEQEYMPPRDDDEYSPAHAENEVGTGVGDEDEEKPVVATESGEQTASDTEAPIAAEEDPAGNRQAS